MKTFMVTKQLIKKEIDNIPEEHLPELYRIVLAFEDSVGSAALEETVHDILSNEPRRACHHIRSSQRSS